MKELCGLAGVEKQAYYKRDEKAGMRKLSQEAFALEFVHDVRKDDPKIGGKKLWLMYRRKIKGKDRMGRDRFEAMLDRYNLKIRLKVRKPRTTDSTHGLPVFPNLVYSFIPERINQLWVSDITYIPVWLSDTEYTFCYLSLISDAYSHEIIGWQVGATLETKFTSQALEMALRRLEGMGPEVMSGLIHHSDRGCQYASRDYVKTLKDRKIQISMTENGNPRDNAMAERINLTVKGELLKGLVFKPIKEVTDAVAKAVDFYNNCRPHMSVDMMTPAEAAKCNGEIKKWWKSYRDAAIKQAIAG